MSNQPPFGDPPPPGGWGTPPGGQPPGGQPPGGWNPQGPPNEPYPPQGQPGYGPPPGYGGGPPPGYGQPPGYGGAPPPGFGGPGGFQGEPPSSSKAPLIVGIIAAVLILGGAAGAFFLLSSDGDDPVAIASATPQASATTEPATELSTPPTATETATPAPRPTATMPEAPPEPAAPSADPAAPSAPDATQPPAPSGSSMDMGEGVQGEITDAALVQEFFFDGVAGEEVVLTMVALDESLDPVLTLFAPDGSELARNDDGGLPVHTDSLIQAELPADGEYRVEASSWASSTGRFELTLTFPSVLSATDTLSASVPEIVYDYDGTAGETVVISMRALEDATDPLVYVLDDQGVEIGRDDDGGDGLDARLQVTLPSDGTYTIVASTFGERYGQFELIISSL